MTSGICKRCGNPTGNPDGRQWYCADCVVAQLRDKRTKPRTADEKQRRRENDSRRKPCRRCGGPKGPGAQGRPYCPTCQVIVATKDKENKPRPITAEDRREKARKRASDWYYEHRDEVLSQEREFRASNSEWAARKNAYQKEWEVANPEMARAGHRRAASTYQARKLDILVDEVDSLFVLERADGVCGICGKDVDPLCFEVDHIIPISRGGEHSYANTQPAHPKCNKTKGAKIPSLTFDSWGKQVPVTDRQLSKMGPNTPKEQGL